MKQNITISLDKDLLKKVRNLAAQKEMSLTKLLSEQLARVVSEDDEYESSRRRALARLRKGFHLGGRILAKREEQFRRVISVRSFSFPKRSDRGLRGA